MFGASNGFLVVDLRGNIEPSHLVALTRGSGLESFSKLANVHP